MLLDSHVVLAVLTDHPRVGPVTRARVEQETVFVSGVTARELTIKTMGGPVHA